MRSSEVRELGTVRLPNGETEGKNPRLLSKEDLEQMGHVPTPILRVIRAKCLDCSHTSGEVAKCTVLSCPLWPYRMGANPFRTRNASEDAKEAARAALAKAREARKAKLDA